MRRARSERERKTSQAIASRASLTARARAEGCRRVGEDGASVAAVAREFGIGWATAMAAVREHGRPRVDDPSRMDGVEAMGLEETVFSAASATRATSFITGIIDLTRRGGGSARLLDVVAGRSASALARWMHQRTIAWRAGIGVAALDPYRGYASALRASLPHATRVLDAFPGVRWGFAAVDQVRCRIQRQQSGHRGRAGDPLYGIRRLLRRAPDHHSNHSWTRLLAELDAGDTPDEQLARTWIAAQELRLLFHCPDRARAAQALDRWLTYCADSNIPELARLAATIKSWRSELLAYFTTGGLSNGPTEAINLLIKKIKRIGHGFRNFDNYRLRLLLHCGVDWHTIQATPIRGRLPRSVV